MTFSLAFKISSKATNDAEKRVPVHVADALAEVTSVFDGAIVVHA